MFEIGIISIILLAVGYWVTLWLMGRHDDVLHGDFVHTEEQAEGVEVLDRPFPERPPFPPKPVIRGPRPPPAASAPLRVRSAAANPVSTVSTPASPASVAPRPDRTDTLQTLLASIKQDLKDASQL